jgi:hypothetical protein
MHMPILEQLQLQLHGPGAWRRLWRVLLGSVLGASLPAALHAEGAWLAAELAPSSWQAYAALVKVRIENALAEDEQLQQAQRSAVVRIWVDAAGNITAVAVAHAVDADLERLLLQRLQGLSMEQTPPAALRWPIFLQLDWADIPALPEPDAASRRATLPSAGGADAG